MSQASIPSSDASSSGTHQALALTERTARAVDRILTPKSIVIVGASADPRSFGGFVLGNLERFGWQGQIHLVSRSSTEINGRPCVSSVDALPEGIDLAVLAIPEAGVEDAVRALAARKTCGAVLFASGYAEAGAEGRVKQERLAAIAAETGIILVGPNCMGFTNFAASLALTFEPLQPYAPFSKLEGAAGIVAQSGAMAANLRDAFIGRGLPLAAIFSTGNEVALGIEDLVAHYIADPAVRVIVVYAEQIRRPGLFLHLARAARGAGKPIVLLMPGRSARAREAAQSHTGALAGDHPTALTLLSREAVVVVDTLDELFDTSAILMRHPRPAAGNPAFMTGSGAMKNIALDFADDLGMDLPPFSAETTAKLTAMLPAYAVAENPLDYTTIGVRQPGLIGEIVETILDDAAIGSLILSIPAGPAVAQRDKTEHIVPVLARTAKPAILVVTGDNGPMEDFFIDAIRASGVPFFRSPDRALRAARRVALYGEALARAARADAVAAQGAARAIALPPAPPSGVYAEYQGKAWLTAAGIAIPKGKLATDADAACAIARELGYPVVIKAQASELPHKSDVGGVLVGLADEAALRAGWTTLMANIAQHRPGLKLDGVLVEAMGARGLELVVGARRDADWGAVVLVGLGGIWIEALKDVRLIPADMDPADIVTELTRLKAAAVLRGVRGAPPVDLAAIAAVVAAIGAQMRANPAIVEIDVNPLVAYPQGALALDALVVCKSQ